MIALIQRVSEARVETSGRTCGQIGKGLLALIGVEKNDGPANVARLAERLADYRVFADGDGKMNLSVKDVAGGLLLVPQFTLAADTHKGTRPSFSSAAAPETASALFNQLVLALRGKIGVVETGVFGADMRVTLCNQGPVTFWLEA